jgi:hypothetical protein
VKALKYEICCAAVYVDSTEIDFLFCLQVRLSRTIESKSLIIVNLGQAKKKCQKYVSIILSAIILDRIEAKITWSK